MPPPTTSRGASALRDVELDGARIETTESSESAEALRDEVLELRGCTAAGRRVELIAVRLAGAVDDERRSALLASLREVRAASLDDDALVPIEVVDVALVGGAVHAALGWPLVEEPSLADELRGEGTGVSPLEALVRLAPIARALDAIHQRGLHHGALGLASIARVGGGCTLRRFGEAQVRDRAGARPPASFAPESVDPSLGPIGPWTDVFALALAFVELVAGRPFGASMSPGERVQRLVDRERRPSLRAMDVGVGAGVERVLRGALAVDPRARPLRASALWTPLADAVRAAPSTFSLQPQARPRVVEAASHPGGRAGRAERPASQWAIGAAIALGVGVYALQTALRPRAATTGVAASATASATSGESISAAVSPVSAPAPPAFAVPSASALAAPADMVEVVLDGATFTLDRTEVTVAAYRRCVEAGGCTPTAEHGLSWSPDDPYRRHHVCNLHVEGRERHPANCVTWRQARAYCAWAGKRLPTGREWEAAAGGRGARFPWGREPPTCTRVVFARYGAEQWGCRDQPVGTAPVDAHPASASPSGALDLAGNVWEWTSERGEGGTAILRGGGWDSSEHSLEIRATLEQAIYNGDVNVGVRCAR